MGFQCKTTITGHHITPKRCDHSLALMAGNIIKPTDIKVPKA